jgi:type II secretory pathway component GspD/PulD (secretin)
MGKLNINAMASFLSTQGRLQTVSNPQLTFVSGSSAELKVGGSQRYISQVGQLVSQTNVSGTNNTTPTAGVGTNTVNTDSIDTGLTVDVAGAYENGVVFANLDLALKNLVGLNPTNSGQGVTIDLPQTTDEKINTVIRVRPGDNLVMAGLVTSADTNSRQGLPLGDDSRIPMFGDDQLQNHELVIIVKPSVVLFSDNTAVAETKKKETAKPLPDAVVIDKDGSQKLVLPSAKNAEMPTPVATKPDITLADPTLTPAQNVPLAASADGAPVDRRLFQRGFSHAFDDMLQPTPTPLSAQNSGGQP